ncbi:MAG: hypothetical protein ACKOSS_00315 [Planctomycetia bacterium]
MKTVLLVVAGAADRPVAELGGRTPLEAAATPRLDRLAREGRVGHVLPVPEGLRPEEGAFALGLLGLDPRQHVDLGAAMDAAALDVPLGSLDQAFRLSLVTADRETLHDASAGHIRHDEAVLLLTALAEACRAADLLLVPGPRGRGVLVWRGARDVRVQTVPPTEVLGRSLRAALPRGTGIGHILQLIDRSRELFATHEVNELRRDLGENPATLVWPWGPGVAQPLPSLHERLGLRGAFVGVEPSMRGLARLQGMHLAEVPGATGLPGTDLAGKAAAACALLADHDLVVVHVDSTAAASRTRDFVSKVEDLERIDSQLVTPLAAHLEGLPDTRLLVVGGEAISVETGRHLTDPVPFALWEPAKPWPGRGAFSEEGTREGGIEVAASHHLLELAFKM